jgi:two-component system sensor histidine kinase/response regulator
MTMDILADLPAGDPRALVRLHRWGGEKLVREMVALFNSHVPVRLIAARQAAVQGDGPSAAREAHSLKSSCAQLGAVRMRAICEQVERLAADGNLDATPSLVDTLDIEFATFRTWLDRATHDLAELNP